MVLRATYLENHLQAASGGSCSGPLDFTAEYLIIIGCCLLGLIWAFINMFLVSKINVHKGHTGYEDDHVGGKEITPHQKNLLIELGHKISEVHFFKFRAPSNSSNRSI